MKKALVLLCMLAVLIVGSDVFAGSIDYLSNQSARYLMTFARTAATDAADIANYNPAGTAFMAKGLYFDFSSQTLFKPYTSTYTYAGGLVSKEVEQDEPTPILPNFYAVYNFGQMGGGNLAAYLQLGIVAGGGSLKWDEGTLATQLTLSSVLAAPTGPASQSFEVSSVYYGAAVGAAYSFLDNMVSASLGCRVVMPKRSLALTGSNAAGTRTIDGEYEYDAVGYTPIIGLSAKPIAGLTIGLRYEFETDLEFEYSETRMAGDPVSVGTGKVILGNIGISDGSKAQYNLPAMLALGVEYTVTPELTVMMAGNIYFLSQADLGVTKNSQTGAVVKDTNEYFGTGWEVSIGATYLVMPELKVGLGFNYTVSGAKDEYFDSAATIFNCSGNPPLDSYTFGLGATYTLKDLGLDITLAGSWTHYIPYDYSFLASAGNTASGTYEKDVYNIAIGVGYRM